MLEWDFVRSVTSMRLMAELARGRGLPVHQSLMGTGIEEPDLDNPALLVTAHQELRLIRNLVESLPHGPALGLDAGSRYHFTAFGALGFAIVSSPTVRSALDVALGYFHLTFAFTHPKVVDTEDETILTLDDTGIPKDLRRFVVERDLRALVTVQRDLFSLSTPFKRLSFSFEAPPHPVDYLGVFGVEPVFNAPMNQAAMDKAVMQLPLPQANDLALRSAVEQCRKLLDERKSRPMLAGQVRDMLAANTAQIASMETVAGVLCLTARTLRRRLQAENTTFAELRDEVRQTLAEEWLSGSSLSVEHIAEMLGYAEATSFINAFKRWTGRTPHAYRLGKRMVAA
jgi:AraC-like DNA-binding protein